MTSLLHASMMQSVASLVARVSNGVRRGQGHEPPAFTAPGQPSLCIRWLCRNMRKSQSSLWASGGLYQLRITRC